MPLSHLALARKYRPQRFADLVGQDPIRSTLEQAVAKNRVAHAYLFAGPRGSGKTTTARLIAKALNCERRAPGESEPCNQCGSCTEITAGTSLDVLEIDGASNRGIEEIRNLRENVKYTASGGRFKVYIIDEAHQLTDYAWNALLKTLEEPPEHVRFVFCTTEPLEVPDTIASRCQVFEFRRLRSEELVKHLLDVARKEAVPLAEDAAALIARASEGSVRDALGRLDQALALSPEEVTAATVAQALGLAGLDAYFDLGEALGRRDPKLALQVMDRLHDRGMDVEEIADGLSHHLRQLLLLAVDPSLEKLVDAAPSDRDRYAAQAKEFRPTDLDTMLGLLLETRGALRRAEAPRILLEVALVELCTLPTAARIEDLIRRLGDLEAKLEGEPGARKAPGTASTPKAGAPESVSAPDGGAGTAAGPATPAAPAPRRGSPPPRAEQEPSRPAVGATALRLVESPSAEVEVADPSDPVVRWRHAVDRVKERKLLLGTCLEEGSFLGMAGGNVRIALSAEHAFHRAMLELKENREILNEELERLYGRGARLLCESAIPPAREAPDAGRTEPKPPPPGGPGATIVERIVELFDGEVLGPGSDEGNA
ncbi:MAG: DNA polymerase III subunit gamma/tau [Candidatus Eisenbacteria bacterium]|uniref:DNA polymerase III subunit gamma/tau n=1 Tax=Eiseniibacteriota bacterium TaxID=2212470 RepID=A0A538T7N7_UNCEI|nr:MAG: DNA polymerase III subunit gamma/tau [Candidatus Eisenbacteria bacterium]